MGKQKISNVQANVIADSVVNVAKANDQYLNLAMANGAFETSHVEKLVALAIKNDPSLDQFKYDKKNVKRITNLVNEIISQSDLKALVEKKMGKGGLAKKKGESAVSLPATLPTMIQSDGPIKANFKPETGHVIIENYGADNLDVTCGDGLKASLEPLMDGEGEPTGDYDTYCPVPEASSVKAAKSAAPESKPESKLKGKKR
jgi:hypothetical protein